MFAQDAVVARTDDLGRGDRIKAALGALALQGLIGYALIVGLGAHVRAAAIDAIKLFDIAPTPPPPYAKPPAQRTRAPRREGAASPPNLKAKATPIVAPPPLIPPPAPPPVIAAPVAGVGSAPFAGAAAIPGPGSGSGGRGSGTGDGGYGDGSGGGGGAPPRWLRGRLKDSDYPDANVQGSLETRYIVGTDGRVARCTVTQSSGSALLDETTCRLVMKRYRYKPATDAAGRPVAVTVVETHSWEIEEAPPPPP